LAGVDLSQRRDALRGWQTSSTITSRASRQTCFAFRVHWRGDRGTTDNPLQILFGVGSETFGEGAKIDFHSILVGTTHGF